MSGTRPLLFLKALGDAMYDIGFFPLLIFFLVFEDKNLVFFKFYFYSSKSKQKFDREALDRLYDDRKFALDDRIDRMHSM